MLIDELLRELKEALQTGIMYILHFERDRQHLAYWKGSEDYRMVKQDIADFKAAFARLTELEAANNDRQ